MAARIITIAQQKGGAGKTTLAVHLAIAMAGAGNNVAVVDIDPQASLATWFAMRCERLGPAANSVGQGQLAHHAVAGWRAGSRIDTLARTHDIVLIDSPPHAETEARIAIRAADLVLIPVQLSPLDVWASRATVALAKAENTPALAVLNRVPARATLTEIMRAALAELDVPLATARIGNRVALASVMLRGRGITEARPRSVASAEISALARKAAREAAREAAWAVSQAVG